MSFCLKKTGPPASFFSCNSPNNFLPKSFLFPLFFHSCLLHRRSSSRFHSGWLLLQRGSMPHGCNNQQSADKSPTPPTVAAIEQATTPPPADSRWKQRRGSWNYLHHHHHHHPIMVWFRSLETEEWIERKSSFRLGKMGIVCCYCCHGSVCVLPVFLPLLLVSSQLPPSPPFHCAHEIPPSIGLITGDCDDGQVLPIIIKNLVWPEKPSATAASELLLLEVRWCMMSIHQQQ